MELTRQAHSGGNDRVESSCAVVTMNILDSVCKLLDLWMPVMVEGF